MKKIAIYYLTIALALVHLNSKACAQNIEFEKKLDNTVQIDEYVNLEQNNIRYYKVLQNKILRIEMLKLQLFEENLDKKWEVNIDGFYSSSKFKEPNYLYVNSDKEFIYLVQLERYKKNSTVYNMKLVRVSENGEIISKNVDVALTRFYNIDVSQNKIYVHFLKLEKESYDRLEFKPEVYVFNQSLDLLNKYSLPSPIENSDVVPKWVYNKFENGQFYYECYYWKSKNNNISIQNGYKSEFKKWEITLDLDLNITFDTTFVLPYNGYSSSRTDYKMLMYNQNEFNIFLNRSLLTNVRSVIPPKEVRIVHKEISNDIYDVIKKFHPKLKNFTEIVFSRFVEDPINNNISIIVQVNYPTRFLFTLNKNLEPVHAQIFKVFLDDIEVKETTGNLSLGVSKSVESVGKYPEGHVMNALDYAVKLEGKPFITILNYSDYQLLFTDNKETGESKVYKFIK